MIELKDELYAAPLCEWQHVPITVNRHKWWLHWYRIGDNGNLGFVFVSPKGRRYHFFVERGKNGYGKATDAEVALANGETIARYWESWGDKPERMDAVLRLTPKHIIDRLFLLLDAIG